MRPRRSLFGPILLITLGAALLWHNLNPQISLGRLFADYWPWLLVLWGGFRLVEFAASRLLGRRPPEPMGGGAVLVAILLCFAGSAAHSFSRSDFEFIDWTIGHGGWFEREYDYDVRHDQSVAEGQRILIRNLDGRIRIIGGKQPGLRVTGRKRVRAVNDGEAARLDERSMLEFSEQGQQFVMQPRPMPDRDERRLSYDISIEIPADTPLNVEGAEGRLEVEGLTQGVTLHGAASIEITGVGGPVRIRARRSQRVIARQLGSTLDIDGRVRRFEAQEVAGTITIDGNGVEQVRLAKLEQPARLRFNNTDIEFQKLPGEIEISPRSIEILDATGPVMLHSRGSRPRRIRLEKISGALVVDAQHSDLTWAAGAKPAATEIKLERGDISVRLDPDAEFAIEAATARGRASHEFGAVLQIEDHDRGKTLKGGRGQGPLLKLETGRGDLKVERSEETIGLPVEI